MDNTTLNYSTLTERINHLCYKIEYTSFISEATKNKLMVELKELIEQRKRLMETTKNKIL